FRVLIMGKANAGKTTILQAVCGTREAPQAYNQTKRSILSPTALRGTHNIEYELRFRSNPRFVFHDSRGFEAGSTEELETVRVFIDNGGKNPKKTKNVSLEQCWFCTFHLCNISIPNERFANEVPVIAIFTKFDSLDSKAYQELRREGLGHSEVQKGAPRRADEQFKCVQLNRILGQRYPPKKELRIRMIKSTVAELLEKISDALDTNALKLLLATVQSNNVELCIKNIINRQVFASLITAFTNVIISVNSGVITAAAQGGVLHAYRN
ncbi:hypothetical protein BOTBODRAFT_115876, partial [Botryobasidium botryosum FD-172 SS1]